MTNIVKKKKNNLFLVALCLFVLHQVPIIGLYTNSILYLGIVLLLYYSAYNTIGEKLFLNYFSLAFPMCLLIFLKGLFVGSTFFTTFYTLLQYIISIIVGLYVVNNKDYNLAWKLMTLLFLTYIVTAITTYYGNIMIPHASRMLAMAEDVAGKGVQDHITSLNIGGFAFVYTLSLCIPILIGMFKNRMVSFVMPLLLIALFFITIYKSEYTTALLMSLLSLPLLFLNKNMSNRKFRVFLAFYIILVLLFISVIPLIAGMIGDDIESHLLSRRLTEITDFIENPQLASTDDSSDMALRNSLYTKSLDAFWQNPLFGSLSGKGLGGHSFLFDSLGILGLIGAWLYWLMFRRFFKYFIKPYKKTPYYGYFFLAYCVSIILTVINTQVFVYFLSLFVPSSIVFFENNWKKQPTKT